MMFIGRKLIMDIDNPWEERDPQETEALRCLVDAEAYLEKAMLNGSIELYSKALEFSKKVIEYFPECAIAHYIAAFAHLKAKGDKDYAKQRYELLLSFKSEEVKSLAIKLKEEIEGTKGTSGTG
jgi:tetratricopeptide (TPR) repeat protein